MPAFRLIRFNEFYGLLLGIPIMAASWLTYLVAPALILLLCYRESFAEARRPRRAWFALEATGGEYRFGLLAAGLIQLTPWLAAMVARGLMDLGWDPLLIDWEQARYMGTSVLMGCWAWILVASLAFERQTARRVGLPLTTFTALAFICCAISVLCRFLYATDDYLQYWLYAAGWSLALYLPTPLIFIFCLIEIRSQRPSLLLSLNE